MTLIEYLADHPGNYPYSIIDKLIEAGCPITENVIKLGIGNYQNRFLNHLINKREKDFSSEEKSSILDSIAYNKNWKAIDIIFPKGKGLDSIIADTVLMESIQEGDVLNPSDFRSIHKSGGAPLAIKLINLGIKIPDQDTYDILIKRSLKTSNLALIRTLCNQGAGEGVKPAVYPDILQFKSEKADEFLKRVILNSPWEELFDLVANYDEFSSLKDILPEYIKKSAFFVRIPPIYRNEFNITYNKEKDKYIESSWDYAEVNSQFLKRLEETLKSKESGISWNRMQRFICVDRFIRNERLEDDRKELEKLLLYDNPDVEIFKFKDQIFQSSYLTKFHPDDNVQCARTPILTSSHGLSRYFPALKIYFEERERCSFSKKRSDQAELSETDYKKEYLFQYEIPDTNKKVRITSVVFNYKEDSNVPEGIFWDHTIPESVDESGRAHVEDLIRKNSWL